MLEYNPVAEHIYREEEQKTLLDSMNVLYVALTRPVKGLYVISETANEVNSAEDATSYSQLFQYYLKQQSIPEKENNIYVIGEFPQVDDSTSSTDSAHNYIKYITRPKGDDGYAISTKSGRLWDDERMEAIEMGNLVHFALSLIKTKDDVTPVLEKLEMAGHFPDASSESINQKILEVVDHPDLSTYFSDEFQILNEREILLKDGQSLRPDRIVISGNEAVIIDYKTGKSSPLHKEQISHYADVLKDMGYTIKASIIVYIDQNIKTVFV